ncbi:MAG: hypothetical protein H0T60_15750 [Acidobacteria bacterium]|nr:hypothetical protein [Acidobacteriota bacterium]
MAQATASNSLGFRFMWESLKELLPVLGTVLVGLLTWLGTLQARLAREKRIRLIKEDKLAKELEAKEEEQLALLRSWYDGWHKELRKEVHDWRDVAGELTLKNARLDGELEILRRDRRDVDIQMAAMQRQLQEKEDELLVSQKRIGELETQVQELKRVNVQENRGNGS